MSRHTVARFLLVAVLVLASPFPHAEAQTQDPAGIVTAIYNKASAGNGDSGGQFLWLNARDRPRSMSKSLAALWDKADRATPQGEIGAIEFDPVTNSQDPSVRVFRVKTERQDASSATVAVTFGAQPGHVRTQPTDTVRYDFVREDGRWKIDDIRGRVDTPWSVREMLTNFLKN